MHRNEEKQPRNQLAHSALQKRLFEAAKEALSSSRKAFSAASKSLFRKPIYIIVFYGYENTPCQQCRDGQEEEGEASDGSDAHHLANKPHPVILSGKAVTASAAILQLEHRPHRTAVFLSTGNTVVHAAKLSRLVDHPIFLIAARRHKRPHFVSILRTPSRVYNTSLDMSSDPVSAIIMLFSSKSGISCPISTKTAFDGLLSYVSK